MGTPVSEAEVELLNRVRLKDWPIENLIEHHEYCERFYNAGKNAIPTAIQTEISSINFSKIDYKNNDSINFSLANQLLPFGWHKGQDIGKYRRIIPDFAKDGIVIEAQFRQDTNILYNLLNIQTAFDRKKIRGGIIITFDARTHSFRSSMNASIQYLDQCLREYESAIHYSVPVWAIGLKEIKSKTV